MSSSQAAETASGSHITEAEASLYDRQIRLWGLEAQNRMRSATVLVLSLRSLAHETIKNLVLAGIGRLIVMDDGVVTEEDLGSGFLFREEEGAVGTDRTAAALPQIASLNPLVTLTAFPTFSPFVRRPTTDLVGADAEAAMVEMLRREKVDVVVACDLEPEQLESIDSAARQAGALFYGAGTYGFYGYVYADLGEAYEYVAPKLSNHEDQSRAPAKHVLSYPPLAAAFDKSKWAESSSAGSSPYHGLRKAALRGRKPDATIALLALWEFQRRHMTLPSGIAGQKDEMASIAEELRAALVKPGTLQAVEPSIIDHLAHHAADFFPPTLAIVGGMLAQDVLRAISRKDHPIANLLVVDTLAATGTTERWGLERAKVAETV
ncbi:E1 ubiquitin-activating protein aos1 [Cryptotrichosporon argae]